MIRPNARPAEVLWREAMSGRGRRTALATIVLASLLLTGCLEQVLSPHFRVGALNNFFLHLYAGELVDARAYIAPGLVERTPALDSEIKSAADSLRRYEIEVARPLTDTTAVSEDLGNGEYRQYLPGRVRPRLPAGQPPRGADEGWEETDILSARMVERGPGWRILEFRLECCQSP
jgi:hypothetical protein